MISGDLSIDIRVKSIQADIDSVKSLAAEAFCIVGKKDTIGRQRYLINAWNLTDHTDQTVTAVSDKRLASGYFDLAEKQAGRFLQSLPETIILPLEAIRSFPACNSDSEDCIGQ